jgi:hypothetical protein
MDQFLKLSMKLNLNTFQKLNQILKNGIIQVFFIILK